MVSSRDTFRKTSAPVLRTAHPLSAVLSTVNAAKIGAPRKAVPRAAGSECKIAPRPVHKKSLLRSAKSFPRCNRCDVALNSVTHCPPVVGPLPLCVANFVKRNQTQQRIRFGIRWKFNFGQNGFEPFWNNDSSVTLRSGLLLFFITCRTISHFHLVAFSLFFFSALESKTLHSI